MNERELEEHMGRYILGSIVVVLVLLLITFIGLIGLALVENPVIVGVGVFTVIVLPYLLGVVLSAIFDR